MNNYSAEFFNDEAPKIIRTVSTEGRPDLSIMVAFSDTLYVSEIDDNIIVSHINNLVSFIKKTVGEVELVGFREETGFGWPLRGWGSVQDANSELVGWWSVMQEREIKKEMEEQQKIFEEAIEPGANP